MGVNADIMQQAKEKYPSVNDEQIQEYADAFNLFDSDNSGKIDATELMNVMNHLRGKDVAPYTVADAQRMIARVDVNSDGEVDFLEFVALMQSSSRSEKDELSEAFKVFDVNGDQTISPHEILSVLSSLGQKVTLDEVELIMKCVETKNPKEINFEEFCRMMSYQPPRPSHMT